MIGDDALLDALYFFQRRGGKVGKVLASPFSSKKKKKNSERREKKKKKGLEESSHLAGCGGRIRKAFCYLNYYVTFREMESWKEISPDVCVVALYLLAPMTKTQQV